MHDEADEVGLFDDEAGGTPRVDWDTDSVPANPEQPTGVVVDERDAKVLANHTFLSNVKWSSISMPWESGFMKNIFGEDVLGLSSDLRQDASWIEAVTHVPVSTIAADSSNPASSGPACFREVCKSYSRAVIHGDERGRDEGRCHQVVPVPSFVT